MAEKTARAGMLAGNLAQALGIELVGAEDRLRHAHAHEVVNELAAGRKRIRDHQRVEPERANFRGELTEIARMPITLRPGDTNAGTRAARRAAPHCVMNARDAVSP